MADDDKKLPTNVIPFPSRDESGLRGLGQEVVDSVSIEALAKAMKQSMPGDTEEVTKALIDVAINGDLLDQDFANPPEMSTFNFEYEDGRNKHIPSKSILFNSDEDYLALPYDIEQQFEDQMDEQYSTYDLPYQSYQEDMYSDKMDFGNWMEDVRLQEEKYYGAVKNLEKVLYKNYSKEFVDFLRTNPIGQQKFTNMITSIEDKYPRYNLFSPDPDDDIDVWRWKQGDPRPSLDKSETVPNITGRQKFFKQKREDDKEAYFQDIKTNVVPTELSRIYNDYTKTIPQPKRTTPERVGDVSEAMGAQGIGRLLSQLADKKQDRGGPRQIKGPKESKPTLNRLLNALTIFRRTSPIGAAAYVMGPTPTAHDDDYDFQIPVDR